MMELNKAIQIAKAYYAEKGMDELTKIYDAGTLWIIYAGKKDQVQYGSSAISIHKTSGEIKSFILPSRENFAILRNAVLVEF